MAGAVNVAIARDLVVLDWIGGVYLGRIPRAYTPNHTSLRVYAGDRIWSRAVNDPQGAMHAPNSREVRRQARDPTACNIVQFAHPRLPERLQALLADAGSPALSNTPERAIEGL